MPLTEEERTNVRRFCGYSPAGAPSIPSLDAATRGDLEFRMSNLSVSELTIVRRYLGTLTLLEFAIPKASDNLDTEQAAVWTRNKDEVRDRLALFDEWRRRLCQFLGVAAGRGLSSGSVALVI